MIRLVVGIQIVSGLLLLLFGFSGFWAMRASGGRAAGRTWRIVASR